MKLNGDNMLLYFVVAIACIYFVTFILAMVAGYLDLVKENNSILESLSIVLVLITVLYLGKEDKLSNETLAAIIGGIVGHVLSR